MLKRIAILMFGLVLLLAACQSAAPSPASQAASTAAVEEQIQELTTAMATKTIPAPTETQIEKAQASPETAAPNQASGTATCTTVSRQPTPGPTEQSLFPPAGEGDWIEGGESASVTIFEYGDFQ